MDGHIRLSIGNVLVIGGVSLTVLVGALAAMHYFSHKDVPLVSPAARGVTDVVDGLTNKAAA